MPKPAEVISHWHHSYDDFNTSTLEFYSAIEERLKSKEIAVVRTDRVDWAESGILSAKREYLRISYGRFSFDLCAAPFGRDFFFSWWLVKRAPDSALAAGCLGLVAAPFVFAILLKMFGTFFGSLLFLVALGGAFVWIINAARSGVGAVEDAILSIPVVGGLYTKYLKPVTYFSEDSRLIFEESVHRIVIENIDLLFKARGVTALTPEQAQIQSRPLLR